MKIQTIPISQIVPAAYNPRVELKPGDPEYEKLKRSLEEFGLVEPVIWNQRTGNLVGGHQRYRIIKESGVMEIEVSVVDLSLEKEKALNLALNKIQGSWDEEKLIALLSELGNIPDFEMELTGFEVPEINQLFDKHQMFDESLESDDEDDPGDQGSAITKRGDLILLGSHRLLCGDSTSEADMKTLFGERPIDLLYTDLPYAVSYCAEQRPTNKRSVSKWLPIANDNLDPKEYDQFLVKFIRNLCPFLTPGAPVYLWSGFAKMGRLNDFLEDAGIHVSSTLVWIKPTPSPSFADYAWQSEYCAYGWKEGAGHRWFGPLGETNVWESPRDAVANLIHPTQKPVSLAQRALKNSSERGNIVFDAFAGSGSTIMAAQSLERVCYAMELEPRYCDAIVRRYIRTFGADSVLADVLQKYSSGGTVCEAE